MKTLLLTVRARSLQTNLKDEIRARLHGRKSQNREGWLTRSLTLMRPWFEAVEAPLPKVVKVTCGWPSSRGTAARGRVIGECWSPKVSKKGYPEIFISPWLGDVDPITVLGTLIHEAVHAAVGTEAGHGKDFRKPATALGLEGRMTATFAGPALSAKFDTLMLRLGHYPHAKMDATTFERPVDRPKVQKNRSVKVQCQGTAVVEIGEQMIAGPCPMLVRASRSVLAIGVPKCANPDCDSFDMTMAVVK